MILPSVEIGEDVLVGAGSLVRERRLEPRTVWAGPAVRVKDDITDLACLAGLHRHAYAWLEEETHRTLR